MSKKLSDAERFHLDIPPEQEDTRAEDEYAQEGLFYKDLDNIIIGYEKNGVFRDHKASVTSVLRMLLEKVEKEPTPEPEKEVVIKMSLKSWNSFDMDLRTAEHHLVGVLAKIRNIRVNISNAMGKKLVDQARDNLIKTMELGERMEEHGKQLEKLAKGTKGEDAKEA